MLRLVIALSLLCSNSAFAADAIYDAAHAAIALRRARGAVNERQALMHSFDASPYSTTDSEPPRGRYVKNRSYLLTLPSDLRDSLNPMPELNLAEPQPDLSQRLEGAMFTALNPWRKLLSYAWDGAWGGSTQLRSWATLSKL
jgi:hypothetical protein